jgi:dolichol-phosphate mannosyltransferase
MKQTKLYGAARRNKIEIKRFGKFAIVGMSGLVVDYFVLNLLTYFFKVAEPVALAVAFVAAAINNFAWNRLWVYPESRTVRKRTQLPIFFAVNAVGLLINELIFFWLNGPIDTFLLNQPVMLLSRHHQGIGLNLTKAVAAIVVMFWNYGINRMVTFRNVKWKKRDLGRESGDPEVESAL